MEESYTPTNRRVLQRFDESQAQEVEKECRQDRKERSDVIKDVKRGVEEKV